MFIFGTKRSVKLYGCRTKRDWKPNVQLKSLYSEVLERSIYLDVTTDVLKRIDRAGGLDMYLLTQPMASKTSIVAEQLRGLIRAVSHCALCTKAFALQQRAPLRSSSPCAMHARAGGIPPHSAKAPKRRLWQSSCGGLIRAARYIYTPILAVSFAPVHKDSNCTSAERSSKVH